MSSVLLVEDDEHTRERLAGIIAATPGLSLLGAAGSLVDARVMLADALPDILLTDLGLPDGSGIDLIKQVRADGGRVEVMVISVFGDERHVISALKAGAAGYILKDGTTTHIGNAILQLLDGGSPISPPIARHLLKYLQPEKLPASSIVPPPSKPSPLSAREVEVLSAVAKGFTYNEIADILDVSFHTVSSHVKHIYRKLEVCSRSEAVYEAINLGLINLDD
ncbi:Two-component transcriptional response regulator, LuxR family [hydrothermal vent metagenome]|uniref:Two-component transcriptional response regulator, LuxR family n=1 Tax=hydrothermal vent metagenome TaxID=652676 RepID=A0A3B0ZAJ5_9ZZZZ